MRELEVHGILDMIQVNGKKLHFLGMVDGPNEIELVKRYHDHITSWDSSAAVWAGVCDIEFDNSPTGLINGKNEIEVDFNHNVLDHGQMTKCVNNVKFIDELTGYQEDIYGHPV
jgi:hypothetical protein